jgi:hypothetical protein
VTAGIRTSIASPIRRRAQAFAGSDRTAYADIDGAALRLGCDGLLEDHLVAEALELADRATGELFGLAFVEEVGSEIGVELSGAQD